MECCAACREPLDPNDRPPVWPCCLARGHSACYGAAAVCPACGAPARLGEADTLHLHARGKSARQAGWQAAVQHHENPAVTGASDQPAKGLAQFQPCCSVRPGITPLPFSARLEQDVGAGPRHAIKNDQAQCRARYIDPVPHRVGAKKAGMRLLTKDLQQRLQVILQK